MPLTQRSRFRVRIRDDVAYVLPMAVFLVLTEIGGRWPGLYPASYIAKTVIVAVLLIVLWPRFTKIRWDFWWLGLILGVAGFFQWVGMENALLAHWPHYPRFGGEPFNPMTGIASPTARAAFIAVRWGGAFLLVPVMEELFWRDFAWRTIQAPNNFKLAAVGERDVQAWILVSLLFCAVHVQWATAIVWGLMIGGLLMITRSLGACIVMHAVTNFLLGLYVLRWGRWDFW